MVVSSFDFFFYLDFNNIHRKFKFIRVAALRYVFEDKLRSAAQTRALRSSLVLGAVSIWMLNALNHTPPSNSRYNVLANACCQHIRLGNSDSEDDSTDEDEDNTVPIGYNRGLYFLADLMEDDRNALWRVPMSVSDRIEELTLAGLYGRESMADLEHEAGLDRVLAPKGTLTHESRISNKRRKTTAIEFARPDIDEDNIDLQLADRGVTIHPIALEAGRDVDERHARSYHDLDQPQTQNLGPDGTVARIWKQTPFDIFAVAPNGARSKDPSHIIMSKHARNNVTWETFKTTNFSTIFEKVQVRMVSDEFWKTTLFDRYFPPKGTAPKERGKLQNFPYTTYYPEWFKLMSQLSDADSKVVRAGLLTEFRKLKWLPHGGSDRMWDTGKMTSQNWKIYPIGSKLEACPQIAVNTATWNMEPITLGIRAVYAREEEEEEEEEVEEEDGEE